MTDEVFKSESQEISATPALHQRPSVASIPTKTTATQTQSQTEWILAVYIRIGHGPIERVESAEEALSYLDHRWPRVDGPYWGLAYIKCVSAATDSSKSQEARKALKVLKTVASTGGVWTCTARAS